MWGKAICCLPLTAGAGPCGVYGGQVVVLRFSPFYVIIPTLRTDKQAKSLKRHNKAFAEIVEGRLEQ